MVMLFVIKHSITKDGFSELLQLFKTFLPTTSEISTSVYHVKEILKECVNLLKPKRNYFCERCQREVVSESANCSCSNETTKKHSFHSLNLEKQLSDLFQGVFL
jgi:predicted amidophosphoribosyltransferase